VIEAGIRNDTEKVTDLFLTPPFERGFLWGIEKRGIEKRGIEKRDRKKGSKKGVGVNIFS
jgi:hypothetical protein